MFVRPLRKSGLFCLLLSYKGAVMIGKKIRNFVLYIKATFS